MAGDNNSIVTISRQFGSGGREIGRLLAERLGVPFYDKELISLAAKETGMHEEVFENADELATSSLLYSLSLGAGAAGGRSIPTGGLPLGDRVYLAQTAVIREIAAKGPCVIVGRCADNVLAGDPRCVHVFIHADLEHRVKRAVAEYSVPQAKAASVVQKTDKRRATYHDYYASTRWGAAESYHVSLNSGLLGPQGSADVLYEFVRRVGER